MGHSRLYIFCNAYYPWMTFAKAIEFEKIVFMDAPSNLDLTDSEV